MDKVTDVHVYWSSDKRARMKAHAKILGLTALQLDILILNRALESLDNSEDYGQDLLRQYDREGLG